MIRLFLSLCLLSSVAFAQKPDFIRTPNGPNTIVDWNLKAKTFILPHGATLGLFNSQDTTGNVFVRVGGGDTSLYFRVGGVKWVKVGGSASAGITVTIPATTTIPYAIAYNLTAQPTTTFYIPTSGGLTTNGTSGMTINYISGVLYIYGNDDGMGRFNENTSVKIVP